MAYKIVITQVTSEEVTERNYVQTGERDGEAVWGYANETKTKDVSRDVYSQHIDELDLVSVINAVNKKGN